MQVCCLNRVLEYLLFINYEECKWSRNKSNGNEEKALFINYEECKYMFVENVVRVTFGVIH